jgi:poly-gamma-glutamate synthesis protein (capsule biosynthesis protein)
MMRRTTLILVLACATLAARAEAPPAPPAAAAAPAVTPAVEWTVRVVGGLTFGPEWATILTRRGTIFPFAKLGDTLSSPDLTFAFLGGGLGDGGEPFPPIREPLRSDPLVATVLAEAGIDAVSIADHRVMDYQADGLARTRQILGDADVGVFGAGENDTLARMYSLHAAGGMSVACLAFLHGVWEQHAGQHQAGTNPALPSSVRQDVANASASADVVLVFFNWGESGGDVVDGRQRLFGHMAIDAGATAVFGVKDQTYLGTEVYKGRPIFYSLGDFVRGVRNKRHGKILVPTLVFEDADPVRVEWLPVATDAILPPGEDPRTSLQPRVLTGAEADEAVATYTALCQDLGTLIERTTDGARLDLATSKGD